MSVSVLAEPYQTAGEKSHIKNWLNMTVGVRIDKVNQNEEGDTTSVAVTVFTVDDTENGESARIESARILGQIAAAGVAEKDVLIVAVVPLGKRGQVFAPPDGKDKAAKALTDALS